MRKLILIIPAALAIIALLAYFLSLVFSGRVILPQTFHVGPLTVHYYGVIIAAAVIASFALAIKRASKYVLEPKAADDLIFWLVIGGFLGARAYHIFSDAAYYLKQPWQIFMVWKGGLSIYGALFGGMLALAVYMKWSKHFTLNLSRYLSILDWLAPSVILGQVIGRFGNLFNYEAFGYPTGLPWGMFVPREFRPAGFENAQFFHPVFLYEILANITILFYLLKRHKNSKPGSLFFSYVLLYNLVRFFLEFLRTDSTFIGNFRLNSLTSLALAAVSAAFLLWRNSPIFKIRDG